MFYIALRSTNDKNVDLREIASEQNIPKHFLSKILQTLVKQKLLLSMKGPNGGFRLSKSAENIRLIEVVEALDGLDIFHECGIDFGECHEKDPCPIHEEYSNIRNEVFMLFKNKTLKELILKVKSRDEIANRGT